VFGELVQRARTSVRMTPKEMVRIHHSLHVLLLADSMPHMMRNRVMSVGGLVSQQGCVRFVQSPQEGEEFVVTVELFLTFKMIHLGTAMNSVSWINKEFKIVRWRNWLDAICFGRR
jgi:hypothetical protein